MYLGWMLFLTLDIRPAISCNHQLRSLATFNSLTLKAWGGGGGLEFPQGTDKSVCIPWKRLFYGLNQFANETYELTTLTMTKEAGYKTSIHQSVMFLCSFVEENQQSLGCTSSFRGLYATKHPFFSHGKQQTASQTTNLLTKTKRGLFWEKIDGRKQFILLGKTPSKQLTVK